MHFLDTYTTSGLELGVAASQLSHIKDVAANALLSREDDKRLEEKKKSRKRHSTWARLWTWSKKPSKP